MKNEPLALRLLRSFTITKGDTDRSGTYDFILISHSGLIVYSVSKINGDFIEKRNFFLPLTVLQLVFCSDGWAQKLEYIHLYSPNMVDTRQLNRKTEKYSNKEEAHEDVYNKINVGLSSWWENFDDVHSLRLQRDGETFGQTDTKCHII